MKLVRMINEILEDYSDIRVSQITGIERTRLNRIRNGKFRITLPELQKIIDCFLTDEKKAAELYDVFLYETIGKDKYTSRKLAKEFLESLRSEEPHEPDFVSSYSRMSINAEFNVDEDITVLKNPLAVRHTVNMVLIQAMTEKQKIRIISSPFSEHLISLIFTIICTERELEIEHIFSLSSSNELPEPLTYYMSAAKAVYPIFMLNSRYQAYYSLSGHMTNALMPYQIITDKFNLLIDPDFTSAVLVSKKDAVEIGQELFDKRKKLCSPFISKINSTEEYLRHYCSIMERTAGIMKNQYYSIDFEPCMLDYLSEEELLASMDIVGPESEAAKLVEKFVSTFYTPLLDNLQISFFTKDGLHSFVETGTIKEIPEPLGIIVNKRRRVEMLECVLMHMKAEKSNKVYYMINENEFNLPMGLRYFGAGVKADHMFVISNLHKSDTDESGRVPSILSLTNPEILKAVFDFIESLPETNMVYPNEKAIAYLEGVIDELKKEI